MIEIFTKHLRTLLIAAVVAIGLFASWHLLHKPGSAEGIGGAMVADVDAPAHSISILFIGNSYTYFNNMPNMVVQIAKSDPDNHTRFYVQSVTRGGIGLKELWEDGQALKLIKQDHWDYVVLQEQSFWAMFPESARTTMHYAQLFDQEIKQAKSRALIFTTWARQPGSHWYTDKGTAFLRDPAYMQQQFDLYTKALADKMGDVVIPVGDYWAAALAKQPNVPLYIADGSHPSPAGSYLTALIFYRYFAGYNPTHISYAPDEVTDEQAKFLRSIATW